jgi:hypothetical protein
MKFLLSTKFQLLSVRKTWGGDKKLKIKFKLVCVVGVQYFKYCT